MFIGLFVGIFVPPSIIPKPVETTWGTGNFVIDSQTKLLVPEGFRGANQLASLIKTSTGFNLKGTSRGKTITFRQKSDTRKLRPDWYWLTVTPKSILVEYSSEAGGFYASQTLRQMLPTSIELGKRIKNVKLSVPTCQISDGPRFPWRGMLLDCSRHFFSVDFIKKSLDRLAMMKMNVFHWHLVDDGGWRMEVKKYPKLTQFGAWRLDTGEIWPGGRWNYANIQFVGQDSKLPKYGGFYTQSQIKEIVKYASERHIEVVPEIELPGHSLGAITSYPDLACDNVAQADKPGKSVSNVYCAGKENTIKFLENVLDETMALFPSRFIHIGADEVLKDYWKACPKCQARTKSEGLNSEHELQSWMVRHFDAYLAKKGRRLIGWDEILEGGLAPGATVMSWRGIDGGIQAARAGRDVIMTPTSHCYFDYSYQAISSEQVYNWNPVPDALDSSQSHHILGGQYNVWTEFIASEARCEELQFPRALAMAEVLWSPANGKNLSEFQSRQIQMMARLDDMGIRTHIPSPQVSFNTILFKERAVIDLPKPIGSPYQLKWTLNGRTPDKNSAEFKGPISIDKDSILTIAFVDRHGRAGEPSRVECKKSKILNEGSGVSGLKCQTYLLEGEPSRLPNLDRTIVNSRAIVQNISESARPRQNKFAVQWEGVISIPKSGAYEFSLTSDDGSKLWIGDALVIDHDGPHGAVEKIGRALLPMGRFQLKLQWFDQGGANSLKLLVSGPGLSKQPVPDSWLTSMKD